MSEPSFCVAVLCVPRSGSSMVAGVLHHLGVHMGDDLLPADRWNQRGYYEDEAFLAFHRAAGFPHGQPGRIRLRLPDRDPTLAEDRAARYGRLIRARAAARARWGLKDPKLVYFFDHFHVLASALVEVRAVVTGRDPRESAESLRALFPDLDGREAARVIADYQGKLDRVLADWAGRIPIREVAYADALADPGGTVAGLAAWLGVPATPAARAFIDPSLRRQALAGI